MVTGWFSATAVFGEGETGETPLTAVGNQDAFLAVGLIMIPGIIVSWFVRDDDVAETRGLVPAAAST